MTEKICTSMDKYGNVWFSDLGLLDAIYAGKNIDNCLSIPSDDVKNYNKYNHIYGTGHPDLVMDFDDSMSVDEFHTSRQIWNMPDEYREIDLRNWFSHRITTPAEKTRVDTELDLYEQRGLFDLLRMMIYIMETLRANNIVWGVGRGSSVASYCLYIIGVHRINSLKFDLDIKEFLK